MALKLCCASTRWFSLQCHPWHGYISNLHSKIASDKLQPTRTPRDQDHTSLPPTQPKKDTPQIECRPRIHTHTQAHTYIHTHTSTHTHTYAHTHTSSQTNNLLSFHLYDAFTYTLTYTRGSENLRIKTCIPTHESGRADEGWHDTHVQARHLHEHADQESIIRSQQEHIQDMIEDLRECRQSESQLRVTFGLSACKYNRNQDSLHYISNLRRIILMFTRMA